MANEIVDRIVFFLRQYSPFESADMDLLTEMAEQASVKYLAEGETLFQHGESVAKYWFIIRKGVISLTQPAEGGSEKLVDKCSEGELLGIRSLLVQESYSLTATAEQESIIYVASAESFTKLFSSDPHFQSYIGNIYIRRKDNYQIDPLVVGEESVLMNHLTSRRTLVTAAAQLTIREAATLMTEEKIGSLVVVNTVGNPIGIVTDTDLRTKVVAKGLDSSRQIQDIMTSPVVTTRENRRSEEILFEMMDHQVRHLVITANGDTDSKATGIVSEHDLLLAQKNHPVTLLLRAASKETSLDLLPEWKAKFDSSLAHFLEQGISLELLSRLAREFNGRLIEKAINHYTSELDEPIDPNFCWLNLGSAGRNEQLLPTDQDNAIIYANEYEHTDQLLEVANKVNSFLVKAGYDACPHGIMAKNPEWCRSLQEWSRQITDWIRNPDPVAVLKAGIFLDFKPTQSGHVLIKQLEEDLLADLKDADLFLATLAQNALQNPPPLSIFKNLILEAGEEHKDTFDIKARAIQPVIEMARVLALSYLYIESSSTIERLKFLEEKDAGNGNLYADLQEAFAFFLRLRAKKRGLSDASGRFIKPDQLTIYEKNMLKKSFEPIRELRKVVRVKFRTDYMLK